MVATATTTRTIQSGQFVAESPKPDPFLTLQEQIERQRESYREAEAAIPVAPFTASQLKYISSLSGGGIATLKEQRAVEGYKTGIKEAKAQIVSVKEQFETEVAKQAPEYA